MRMANLSLQDIEFIKILANSDSVILKQTMNEATFERLEAQIAPILCEYFKENTMGLETGLTKKFRDAGISEDEGKAAIACARRLGIEIFKF